MPELCQKGKRKETNTRDSDSEKEREGRREGGGRWQDKTKATKTSPQAVKILKNIGQCHGFDCDHHCGKSQIMIVTVTAGNLR